MIYVECKPDTALVRTITGLGLRQVIHDLKGKPGVIGTLRGLRNARAMVDEDPFSVQPQYLSQMQVAQEPPGSGLRLMEHPTDGNLVVMLCPRLEEWVLQAAREAQVDVSRYNLPSDARRFKSEINDALDRFQRLVEALDEAPRVQSLRQLLRL